MIIFDFDQTLVNTRPVEVLRQQRKWSVVMAQVAHLEVYAGISELLNELHAREHTLAIVTKSPDMIPHAIIKQHKWPVDIVIGYHQVKRRKPDPEGLIKAMKQAGARPESSFHIGDQPEDTEASRAANVAAIGAGWGIADARALERSAPDCIFFSVAAISEFFLAP